MYLIIDDFNMNDAKNFHQIAQQAVLHIEARSFHTAGNQPLYFKIWVHMCIANYVVIIASSRP